MNPITQAAHKVVQTMHNAEPPKTQPAPTQPHTTASFQPEIVSDIAVQNPINQTADFRSLPNPIVQVAKPSQMAAVSEDRELKQVLGDVNSSVKKTEDGVPKKVDGKEPQVRKVQHNSPPIAATVVALVIAFILTLSALAVFKQGS